MKYISFILFFSLSCLSAYTQSWISSNNIQGTGDVSDIQSTTDTAGSVITLGYFEGTLQSNDGKQITSNGMRDYFVSKYNETGEIEWLLKLGGPENEFLYGGISTDEDGYLYVTGGFRGTMYYTPTEFIQSFHADDIFLAKYDLDGNVIWCRNIGTGQKNQRTTSLNVDPAGDILLAGFFVDSIYFDESLTLYNDNTVVDYFYGKFDPGNGDPIWVKQINGIDNTLSGRVFDIAANGSSYLFTGVFYGTVSIGGTSIVSDNNTQDVHLFKTDLSGNIEWIRLISGEATDYSFSTTFDPVGNVYLGGYSNSTTLSIDSTETHSISLSENQGGYDIFISKYSSLGQLQWIRSVGGKGSDILLDIEVFNIDNNIYSTGHFADTIYWGGIELATEDSGIDMYIGSMDGDGNFRSANSYAGRNNSNEESFSIFEHEDELFTVIRSNSDVLVLGNDIYAASGLNYHLSFGVIGCLPISIDNTIYNNVETCYGDSTGSIQVSATGGFDSPWQYSIDNGLIYSDLPFFGDLPVGDYQVAVVDKEGCVQTGQLVTLTQPDTLLPSVNLKEDILHHTNWLDELEITQGNLVITAAGGTGPYLYTLIPAEGDPGIPQALGTFAFALEDSGKYVVALNDFLDCGPSETDTIEINVIRTSTPDGIEGLDGVEVKMYPNPTSGLFTLEMLYDADECPLEVINMTGQVVVQQKIYPNSGMISEVIDLSKAPEGLYMIRIDGRSLKSAVVVK